MTCAWPASGVKIFVAALRAYIAQVRLDVAFDGQVQAAYAEAPGHKLSVPLQLSPAVKAEYFDVSPSPHCSLSPLEQTCIYMLVSYVTLTWAVSAARFPFYCVVAPLRRLCVASC